MTKVTVLSDDLINWMFFSNFLWKWFFVFLNLMFCTNAIISFSKGMNYFTFFGYFENLNPYLSAFMPFVFILSLHNAFHLILLITMSIFSINYNKNDLFCGIRMFFIEYSKLIWKTERKTELVSKSSQLFWSINNCVC